MSYDVLVFNILLGIIGPAIAITTLAVIAWWRGLAAGKHIVSVWLGGILIVSLFSFQKNPVRFTLTDDTPPAVRGDAGVIKSSREKQTDAERLQSTRDAIDANNKFRKAAE